MSLTDFCTQKERINLTSGKGRLIHTIRAFSNGQPNTTISIWSCLCLYLFIFMIFFFFFLFYFIVWCISQAQRGIQAGHSLMIVIWTGGPYRGPTALKSVAQG